MQMEPNTDEVGNLVSKYVSRFSQSMPADASFNERERLYELQKQIQMKKAYRDDLRRLSSGLYALKLGMQFRSEYVNFTGQLGKEHNSTIIETVEKHRKAAREGQKHWQQQMAAGSSRQAFVDQSELQKLQEVVRLQDELRVKLAGAHTVKQVEREQATLRSEESIIARMEATEVGLMQKHKEMLDQKYREIAGIMVQIGENQEMLEKLRVDLAEASKQHRDEQGDEQDHDPDESSDDGKQKPVSAGENDGVTQHAQLFEAIDCNIGNVVMDFRLDLNFKNPNDFPDILTRLSKISEKAAPEKDMPPSTTSKGRKAVSRINNAPRGDAQVTKRRLFQTCLSSPKKAKETSSGEKENSQTDKEKEYMSPNDSGNKCKENDPYKGTSKQMQRKNANRITPPADEKRRPKTRSSLKESAAITSNEVSAPSIGRISSPMPRKRPYIVPRTDTGTLHLGRSTESSASLSKSSGRTPSRASAKTGTECGAEGQQGKTQKRGHSPSAHDTRQQKKPLMQQNQQEEPQKGLSSKLASVPSPHSRQAVKGGPPVGHVDRDPIDEDENTIGEMEGSMSSTSLDFDMQSPSSEFDMDLSGEFHQQQQEAEADEDLDFLSETPTKSARGKAKSGGGGADSFDFSFGDPHAGDSMQEQEDDFF